MVLARIAGQCIVMTKALYPESFLYEMPIVFLADDRVGTPRSCWTVPQETTLHGGTTRWSLGTAALSKQKPVEAQLVTDASQTGWGAVLSGKQATGYRDKQVALIPSN